MRGMTHHRQQGFMAIVLVVFLVVFVAMAAAIVSMSTSGARGAADHVQASAALFMAESGIEWGARELFDAENPQSDCEALEGQSRPVNGGGSFTIIAAEYLTGSESCRLTSRGHSSPASRTLVGLIPKRVMDGAEGGGDDLFDDASAWAGGQSEVIDGVLYIKRQGGNESHADGRDVLTDDFEQGDQIYFAANVSPGTGGMDVRVRFPGGPGNYAVCADGNPCASVDPDNPLHSYYNTVWVLSSSVAGGVNDVNDIRIRVDFDQQPANVDEVAVADGCIGRLEHCLAEGSDDPTEDGGWNEDP